MAHNIPEAIKHLQTFSKTYIQHSKKKGYEENKGSVSSTALGCH